MGWIRRLPGDPDYRPHLRRTDVIAYPTPGASGLVDDHEGIFPLFYRLPFGYRPLRAVLPATAARYAEFWTDEIRYQPLTYQSRTSLLPDVGEILLFEMTD